MKDWVLGARPRTLPAAIVPVIVGSSCALVFSSDRILLAQASLGIEISNVTAFDLFSWLNFVLALVVALALQVGTNYVNDYADGVRGTDDVQRVGPMRLVGSGKKDAKSVKVAAFIMFGIAGLAGFLLAVRVSWWLLLVGSFSILSGWFYTGGKKPYGYYGLGELFVFIFFGVVATVGSAFVQVHEIVPLAFWFSLALGSIATALLVINNLRDIPTDTQSNKRTLAVRIGDTKTRMLYVVLLVIPFVIVPPVAGISGHLLLVFTSFTIIFVHKPVLAVLQKAVGKDLIVVLGQTGKFQLIFGCVLSILLIIVAT